MFIKLIIFILIFFLPDSYAKKTKPPELLFTLESIIEGSDLKVKASLVVMSNGSFNFESNTGGLGFCGRSGVGGKFQGVLAKEDLEALKQQFDNLRKDCSKIKNCHTKFQNKKLPSTYFRALGWHKRAKENYFIEYGEALPKFIGTFISLEEKIIKKPIEGLKLEQLESTNKSSRFKISSVGGKNYPIIIGDEVFLVYGKKTTRILKKIKGKGLSLHKETLGPNSEYIFDLNYSDYGLSKGDELVYRPTSKDLNPCVVLK